MPNAVDSSTRTSAVVPTRAASPGNETGIPWTDVVFKGLNIKGIYGREMYETWYKMVMMIQSGLPIERVITHRFHYTEFQQGFDIMRSGQSGKVILDWKD